MKIGFKLDGNKSADGDLDDRFPAKTEFNEIKPENELNIFDDSEAAKDGIIIIQNDVIRYANPSAAKIFGCTTNALTGRNFSDTLPDDGIYTIKEFFRSKASVNQTDFIYEARLTQNPSTVYIEMQSRPVTYEKKTSELLIIRDITRQKQAEALLIDAKNRYQALFENTPIGISVSDREGNITEANRYLVRLIGYSVEELKTINFSTLHADPTVRNRVITELKATGNIRNREIRFKRKDGGIFHALINVDLITLNGGEQLLSTIRDITEQKQLEAQLFQSQKMEAIGTLTGSITHDFNNLLSVITANTDLALLTLPPGNPLHETIKEIRKAVDSAAALTRQLLAFSRKQSIQPEILNINNTINNMEKMLCRLIGQHIDIKIIKKKEACKVNMDPGQIEQVIMNLAVNARDAMPEGGTLTIETANVELNAYYIQFHGIKTGPGSYVMIAVKDTGVGMDKTIRARIFEPFFTTKGKNKGTGLGLSTVYGIIKQNKGFVRVSSEPGWGTNFRIYLPAVEDEKDLSTG